MEDTFNCLDDCYFYFYSTCTKGDSCPYRHCEAALGTEMVCSLWKDGRCFRQNCKFRHMESNKNRSSIPCYWESQPGGCKKPHCVFLHLKNNSQLENAKINENELDCTEPSIEETNMLLEDLQHEQLTQLASPVVEPVVVQFDEESDTESYTGTPIKMPPFVDQDRLLSKRFEEGERKQRIISLKKSAVKQNLENKELNFHIKSLAEIKDEKAKSVIIDIFNPDDKNFNKRRSYLEEKAVPEIKETKVATKRLQRDLGKRKLDVSEKSKESSFSKIRISTKAKLERKTDDALNNTQISCKPQVSTHAEQKRRPLTVKRKITLQSLRNTELPNIKVKTLDQIRAEKQMKLVESDLVAQTAVEQEVRATGVLKRKIELEENIPCQQNTKGERVTDIQKPVEINSSPVLKKLRLKFNRHAAFQEAMNSSQTDSYFSEANSLSKDEQLIQSTDMDANVGACINKNKSTEEIDNSSVIKTKYSPVRCAIDEKVTPRRFTGENDNYLTTKSKWSPEKQVVDYVAEKELSVSSSPQKIISEMTPVIPMESETSTLSEPVESISAILCEVSNVAQVHPSISNISKRVSLDDDLDLLLEDSAGPCLDDNVELQDDDVLRELDEAIK